MFYNFITPFLGNLGCLSWESQRRAGARAAPPTPPGVQCSLFVNLSARAALPTPSGVWCSLFVNLSWCKEILWILPGQRVSSLASGEAVPGGKAAAYRPWHMFTPNYYWFFFFFFFLRIQCCRDSQACDWRSSVTDRNTKHPTVRAWAAALSAESAFGQCKPACHNFKAHNYKTHYKANSDFTNGFFSSFLLACHLHTYLSTSI